MNQDRTDAVFLVLVLTLSAGVPLALYTVYLFAESIQLVVAAVLAAIVVVAGLGVLAAFYRDVIVAYLLGLPRDALGEISPPASEALEAYSAGETEKGRKALVRFLERATGYYAWVQTRRWIAGAAVGLLIGFAGLVGSALLKQQNDLILSQNSFFREQIDQQQRQLELQQDVANQTIRAEAIRRIYGPEYRETPRVRAEAVRSLVVVERARIAVGENTLPTEYVNLHDADLSQAWLDSADLRVVSFRGANLSGANFNSANLEGAVFRFNRLGQSNFISTNAQGIILSFSDAPNSSFSNAILHEATFNQTNLKGSSFSGADVGRATFYRVNLEGADMSDIKNWRALKSVEGSNFYGIRGAPDGFVEWVIENGAIVERGALEDLAERADEIRRQEEGVDQAN